MGLKWVVRMMRLSLNRQGILPTIIRDGILGMVTEKVRLCKANKYEGVLIQPKSPQY
jgi:hypothetical protein